MKLREIIERDTAQLKKQLVIIELEKERFTGEVQQRMAEFEARIKQFKDSIEENEEALKGE